MSSSPLFRSLGRRAAFRLVSPNGAAKRSSIRAFQPSSLLHVEAKVVDKKISPPPKASNPPPVLESSRVMGAIPQKKNMNKTSSKQRRKNDERISRLPTSSWVIIRNTPPMSTLMDIVQSINEVMDVQAEHGIVDLDAVWKGGGQVSMLEFDSSQQEWVRSAHIVLSSHGRPSGWRIEFANRSIAHAFLEHTRANQFHCAWKPVSVEEWDLRDGNTNALNISDSMIRVEGAGDNLTVDHVRHLFRRYDMTRQGESVRVFNKNSAHKLFVVSFADASWARAAVRELQGVKVRDKHLRLAQYPRQLIGSNDNR